MIFGRQTVADALRAGVNIEKIILATGLKPAPILDEIRGLAAKEFVVVEEIDRDQLDRLTARAAHQGVIARVPEFEYADRNSLAAGDEPCRLILLDGVTDPANVGSVLRSAEAFGWTGLLIPKRRSAGVTPAVRKVAAGAAERIPVSRVGSAAETVAWLKKEGVWVCGLEPKGAVDYIDYSYPQKICLVVGAEGRGLSRLVSERCDALLRIPMQGSIASINAAVAAAIVMANESHRRARPNGEEASSGRLQ